MMLLAAVHHQETGPAAAVPAKPALLKRLSLARLSGQ
jgi:hypothetical protein